MKARSKKEHDQERDENEIDEFDDLLDFKFKKRRCCGCKLVWPRFICPWLYRVKSVGDFKRQINENKPKMIIKEEDKVIKIDEKDFQVIEIEQIKSNNL